MKDKYNIEEVFKSELEDFEMEVPEHLWNNIAKNIPQAPVGTSSFLSLSGNTTLFTMIGVVAVIAVVSAVAIFTPKEKTVQKDVAQQHSVITEQKITKKEETNNKNDRYKEEQKLTTNISKENSKKEIDPVLLKNKQKENTSTTAIYIVERENNSKHTEETQTLLNSKEEKSLTEEPKELEEDNTTTTITEELEVIEVPITQVVANINASSVGGYAPLFVEFSHPEKELPTKWWVDGELIGENPEMSYTFETQGTYVVELEVKDKAGKTSTATKTIEVMATSSLGKIPNVFTPNNDGMNDVFKINTKNIATFNLMIYSKKGNLIYQTNNSREGWKGTNQLEEPMPIGDYIYIIKAVGEDGKLLEKKGFVKLLR